MGAYYTQDNKDFKQTSRTLITQNIASFKVTILLKLKDFYKRTVKKIEHTQNSVHICRESLANIDTTHL